MRVYCASCIKDVLLSCDDESFDFSISIATKNVRASNEAITVIARIDDFSHLNAFASRSFFLSSLSSVQFNLR